MLWLLNLLLSKRCSHIPPQWYVQRGCRLLKRTFVRKKKKITWSTARFLARVWSLRRRRSSKIRLLEPAPTEAFTTIWCLMIIHWLQCSPPGGATCTDCKFASVANWATIICIGSKFGHQVVLLALVLKLATRLHHCIATLPSIALLALSVGIELVSSSARVTSVKSQQGVSLTHSLTHYIRTQR